VKNELLLKVRVPKTKDNLLCSEVDTALVVFALEVLLQDWLKALHGLGEDLLVHVEFE
jgi:hypothetical protein